MKNSGLYKYVTNCVGSTYEDITALVRSEKEVSLRTFRQAIGVRAWRDILAGFGYDRHFPISRDWMVRYYKGVYRSVPAYFIRHSRIEYIFTLNGREGPSLAEERGNPTRRVRRANVR